MGPGTTLSDKLAPCQAADTDQESCKQTYRQAYSSTLLDVKIDACPLTLLYHLLDHLFTGVSLNYRLDSGLNDARILFPGTACAAIAIIVGGLAHIENQKHLARKRQQQLEQGMFKDTSSTVDLEVRTGSPTVLE